jgi:hypothetical protein
MPRKLGLVTADGKLLAEVRVDERDGAPLDEAAYRLLTELCRAHDFRLLVGYIDRDKEDAKRKRPT